MSGSSQVKIEFEKLSGLALAVSIGRDSRQAVGTVGLRVAAKIQQVTGSARQRVLIDRRRPRHRDGMAWPCAGVVGSWSLIGPNAVGSVE